MHAAGKTLLILGALVAPIAVAGPSQNIELTDGSIVRARVESLNNDTYVLRSDTLGRIEIPAAKIRTISSGKAAAPAPEAMNANAPQIDGIRKSIVNDPAAMNKIQSLQNDPLVKNILNDPDTMRAINSGDLNALRDDPKIKALMEHSTVQELTQGAR